jgi:hypothetical protein
LETSSFNITRTVKGRETTKDIRSYVDDLRSIHASGLSP